MESLLYQENQEFNSSTGAKKLTRVAAAILCSVALTGSADAESASASPMPSITKSRRTGTPEKFTAKVGQASNTHCGNPPFDAPTSRQLKTMRCLINQVRINELFDNPALDQTAMLKTDDQINCGDLIEPISHEACGQPPFAHFPSGYSRRGEILAWGRNSYGSARAIFAAWRLSPTHWTVIENENFTELGLAEKRVGDINYFTGEFGLPF